MSLEPNLDEQELLEETLRRRMSRMTAREWTWGALSAVGLIGIVAVLWSGDPPGAFAIAPAAACLLVLALSMSVQFETPLGYTVPTQLAFIPLLFALPLALVPIAVMAACAL